MRSDRLLRGMHKVFSHDLPNQMVALQSLLQLLNADEAAHLTNDGHEYVRRLQNATQRACEQVRFLKEMGRINSLAVKTEPIALGVLAQELQGILQQRHAGVEFAFAWQWHVPSITADPRTMMLALAELLGALMHLETRRCRISGESAVVGAQTELTITLEEPCAIAAAKERWNAAALDQRLELVLAREWLAVSDARLALDPPTDTTIRMVISVPN